MLNNLSNYVSFEALPTLSGTFCSSDEVYVSEFDGKGHVLRKVMFDPNILAVP